MIKNLFVLRLKTASTNTYLFNPIESMDFDTANSTVTFTIPPSQGALLNEGQYYKVQLAYIDKTNTMGYLSTLGLIKYTSEPANIYIENMVRGEVNSAQKEFVGVYEFGNDTSEKAYSYRFIIRDNNGIIINTYKSIREAARSLGNARKDANIINGIKTHQKRYGYYWEYASV